MDSKQIRLANLLALEAEYKTLAALSEKTGVPAAYLSQIKNSAKGRGMGSATARKIEEATGKGRGWMDVPHDTSSMQETRAYYGNLSPEKQKVLVLWDQLLSGQRAEHLARLESDAKQAAGIVDEVRQRFANLPSRAATPEQQPAQAPSSNGDRSGKVVDIPPASARLSEEPKLIPWSESKSGKKGKKK